MLLIAAAQKSLDPDLLGEGDEPPKVSVAEAISILKSREAKTGGAAGAGGGRGWIEPEADEAEGDYEQACESIIGKLERLGERDRAEKSEGGWSWCDEHRVMVPPGWGRPEEMAIAQGAPRGTADQHCPHCGGGLSLAVCHIEP